MKIVLERVENLTIGDVFRISQPNEDLDFRGMPWRKVEESVEINHRSIRIHSNLWPMGEALGRYELVQKQEP